VIGPLEYVVRFLMISFFVVLVHEAAHVIAHPRDVRGFYISLDKRQGIVFAVDVERDTTLSLLAPQVAVPLFLTALWVFGYIHWVEAIAVSLANAIASWHDITLLLGKTPTPTRTWRVGIYLEPPHLRIGWL